MGNMDEMEDRFEILIGGKAANRWETKSTIDGHQCTSILPF